jgi:hypothetical protein
MPRCEQSLGNPVRQLWISFTPGKNDARENQVKEGAWDMTQSHKCAFLNGDLCQSEEHCQYKLTTACYPLGEYFCGKDQILSQENYTQT